MLAVPDPNVKYKIVPVEAVMRGYLTGVTDTSIWSRYQKGIRQFDDLNLPDGMKKNEKLPRPVFDPTTKEEKHDRTLTPEELIKEGLITQKLFDEVKETATRLFMHGQEIAANRGLILVDTKYEFGTEERGDVLRDRFLPSHSTSAMCQTATLISLFDPLVRA